MTIPVPQEPDDPRYVANGIDADGNLTFKQVGIEDINYTGRFGALATSTTENTISIGEKFFTLDFDDGKFRVGDDILITALDPDCFMWGEIIGSDTVASPLRLRVYVDDISSLTGTFSGWTLQVVARPKPGIEKDTSTSSVDPTGAGPFTFTVTASKFFPLGGTLLIKPTTDRSLALLGKVKAYSSTSLVVEKTFTNATVSQSYTSWAIALLDAPTTALTITEQEGLRIFWDDFDTIAITPGRIRDSTDTIDLVLPSRIVKDFSATFAAGDGNGSQVAVAGAGTISTSGTTVTGTGTNFLTILSPNITPYDYGTTGINGTYDVTSPSDLAPVITTSTISAPITVSNNTSGTSTGSMGVSGVSWTRGGWAGNNPSAVELWYSVVLIRKDADGSIDVCMSSVTPSGNPDLPSGYTYFRLIGMVTVDDSGTVNNVYQRRSVAPFSVMGRTGNQYDWPVKISTTSGSAAVLRESGGAIGWGTVATAGIADDAVSNAKLANMAQATFKGRASGAGTGDPTDLTATEALTIIKTVDGSGSGLDADTLDGSEASAFAQNAFKTIAVSGQSDVVADSPTDTLTLAAGSNITITTNATTDTVTIEASGGGTSFPADMGLITESATITFDLGTIA